MASSSKGKGAVPTITWRKHLKKFWKRIQNRKVRADGKEQTKEEN
jgi:hypothetical protein